MMTEAQHEKVFRGIMRYLRPLEFEDALAVMGGMISVMMHSVPQDKRAAELEHWVGTLMDVELQMVAEEEHRRHELH